MVVMTERMISASRFKAECFGPIDDVAKSGEPLTITKRGKPLVRILPLEATPSLAGSVTLLVSEEGLAQPLVERSWRQTHARTRGDRL